VSLRLGMISSESAQAANDALPHLQNPALHRNCMAADCITRFKFFKLAVEIFIPLITLPSVLVPWSCSSSQDVVRGSVEGEARSPARLRLGRTRESAGDTLLRCLLGQDHQVLPGPRDGARPTPPTSASLGRRPPLGSGPAQQSGLSHTPLLPQSSASTTPRPTCASIMASRILSSPCCPSIHAVTVVCPRPERRATSPHDGCPHSHTLALFEINEVRQPAC
jgi:hypothetical protein